MVLANEQPGITGTGYRDVLERAGLEDAFRQAWGADIRTSRVESGLGSMPSVWQLIS